MSVAKYIENYNQRRSERIQMNIDYAKENPYPIDELNALEEKSVFKLIFDENGNPLPDEVRLTRVGSIVRSASLDELLQLVNVIMGDMSLVGPRPLLMQYLLRYSPEQAKRHNVKPGITGWAQVNGRNAISWDQKFIFDVEYVKKQSFLLDLKILWMTFINVIQRKGISADGHVTIEEFKG